MIRVYPLKDGKVAFVGIGMPQGDSTRSAVSIIKLSSQVATAIGKLKQLKNDDDTLNIEIFSDLNVKGIFDIFMFQSRLRELHWAHIALTRRILVLWGVT